ncbi:hypothetical protein IV203_007013 [Nitzschia inconspicua]|uniref:F-box domain-containing protein n=1 Tax=Nitzschia inconspicua TaxID=303405 RepID=A0A9K3PCS8_9STRA|nr:hypothetical protein IV203_007013 [Nitzschia inconspicua]
MSRCSPTTSLTLITLPDECQVHILTYLRACDLSPLQQSCKFYYNKDRIHKVVSYFLEEVYGRNLTHGICIPVVDNDTTDQKVPAKNTKVKKGSVQPSSKAGSSLKATSSSASSGGDLKYTLEHLRSIELTVVARVLSLPEPKSGFYVSKSWIKKTLLWLETVNDPSTNNEPKKLSKKQQRQRNRRLSDVSPPWPNINSDILCEHQKLQRCSAKTARSRRKLMDKQAWKVLRKLYPDSTTLESVSGECLQCLMETEAAKKTESDRLEQAKLERKMPLANPLVRRFYTRTKGVPTDCLVETSGGQVSVSYGSCPLIAGKYVILPRSWCHKWRRYMKTGEGGMPLPPDSSALLCDAHKLALLPPHLEAFLCGKTAQLLASVKHDLISPPAAATAAATASPVGVRSTLDLSIVNSLMAAGISQGELASQRVAMMQIQEEQQQQHVASAVPSFRESGCNNDLLDRENHVVIELISEEEWTALQETGCWPKQVSHYSVTVDVDSNGQFGFSTLPCRDCDASGLRFTSCASVKNKFRSKRWEPKSVEQKRIPNLEY